MFVMTENGTNWTDCSRDFKSIVHFTSIKILFDVFLKHILGFRQDLIETLAYYIVSSDSQIAACQL